MIEVEGLRKEYGGVVAVEGSTFSVDPGEVFGLVGPNGAGKTTLLKVISGEQRVDAGTVTREGVSIGYLEQDVQELPDNRTVRDEALRAFDDVLALEEKEQQISREL